MNQSVCFHCGQPVALSSCFMVTIFDEPKPMCCIGCQSVAQLIVDSGLEDFYRYREGASITPDTLFPDQLQQMDLFDTQEAQQQFVHSDGDILGTSLIIEGVSCAACAWVIEKKLQANPAVKSVSVNTLTHKAYIEWNNTLISLSALLKLIYQLGYKAHPYRTQLAETLNQQERRYFIRRLAVAGIGMMQVMMLAVGLYAGDMFGIASTDKHFLRSVSWLFATVVLCYSAQPFFKGAWRSLRAFQLSMDVPVAVAMLLAYSASVWATLQQTGEVYFDSVTMFTFFLLTGRFLEQNARSRAADGLFNWQRLLPFAITRVTKEGAQDIPLSQVVIGDRLRIKPGDTVPVDGVIVQGFSRMNEAILTGESLPQLRKVGDTVLAGSINVENVLEIEAQQVGSHTLIGKMHQLIEQAQRHKPHVQLWADRIAGYFIATILTLTVLTYLIWLWYSPHDALWIAISVLVVTCPCALSLATPVALTSLTSCLSRNGILLVRNQAVESISDLACVCFDKTGTLTSGKFVVEYVNVIENSPFTQEQILSCVAALEQYTSHPIALAFKPYQKTDMHVQAIEVMAGQGVQGSIQGHIWYVGKSAGHVSGLWLQVLCDGAEIAKIQIADQLRDEALPLVQFFKKQGIECCMLTGDSSDVPERIAAQLGVDKMEKGLTAAQKLTFIQQRQAQGQVVMMVGDGVNDAPVLAAADFSIAMSSAKDITQNSADCVLTHENLSAVAFFVQKLQLTSNVIKQNIMWTRFYNALAIPLAMMGFVPPYLAAIGMSLSSLIVVLNARRINRI